MTSAGPTARHAGAAMGPSPSPSHLRPMIRIFRESLVVGSPRRRWEIPMSRTTGPRHRQQGPDASPLPP